MSASLMLSVLEMNPEILEFGASAFEGDIGTEASTRGKATRYTKYRHESLAARKSSFAL